MTGLFASLPHGEGYSGVEHDKFKAQVQSEFEAFLSNLLRSCQQQKRAWGIAHVEPLLRALDRCVLDP